ncbi:MAG: hypothetical protein ACOC3E_02410 [Cyanobacteriota bacterium]
MLGNFQQSHLRIELDAPATVIRDSLLRPFELRQWLFPQGLPLDLPEKLYPGLMFPNKVGPITIQHEVDVANDSCLRLLLSQGIDGYHEWYWGEGWVQSRLEGISLLPLNLAQTMSLLRLREYVKEKKAVSR